MKKISLKDKIIPKTKSEKILLTIFIILLIIVISLFVHYLTMDKPVKTNNEISFPLLDNNSLETSISLSKLNEEGIDEIEYLFQIKNYNNDKVNQKIKNYNIELLNTNNYDLSIKLEKLNDETYRKINISKENSTSNLTFKGKEKEEHNYKITISSTEEFEDFSFIGLSINPTK